MRNLVDDPRLETAGSVTVSLQATSFLLVAARSLNGD